MYGTRFELRQKNRSAQTALARIAAALQVPVNVFTIEHARPGDVANEARETLEVVRLFQTIRDPDERQRCLDLVRAMATEASTPSRSLP